MKLDCSSAHSYYQLLSISWLIEKPARGHHLWHFSLQVLLKSNRIDVLLSRLLPHGQLLFLNHRFAQSLEKEVAAYMAK